MWAKGQAFVPFEDLANQMDAEAGNALPHEVLYSDFLHLAYEKWTLKFA